MLDLESRDRPVFVGVWIWLCLAAGVLVATVIFPESVIRAVDFRAFYTAGKMVLHEPRAMFDLPAQKAAQDLWVGYAPRPLPFFHPAYEAWLYSPLTILSYRAAYFVYLLLSLGVLAGCFAVVRKVAARRIETAGSALVFLTCLPVVLCLIQGQDSLMFLLMASYALWCFERADDVLGGAVLGIAMFKPQIVLFLSWFVFLRRGSRVLTGFVPTALTVVSFSVWSTGLRGALDFLAIVRTATIRPDFTEGIQRSVVARPVGMPNLNGVLYMAGARFLSSRAAFLLTAVGSLVLLVVGSLLVRRMKTLETGYCVALCCAVLLSPHLYLYDDAVLVLPVILLQGRMHKALRAVFYGLPWVLFVLQGTWWFGAAGVIPMLFIWEAWAEVRGWRTLVRSSWRGSIVRW